MLLAIISLLPACAAIHGQAQTPLQNDEGRPSYYQLPHSIERVAVIGAGHVGLMQAAALLDAGFQVRMFERAPRPGGQWLYTDKTPVSAPFPNRPIEMAGYIPDVPNTFPFTRYYDDGDEGLSNDWRIREHWQPSSVWAGMTSTLPGFAMSLPNIKYPPDAPWRMPNRLVQRHIRQYAASVGLNSNDEENGNVTSYSTRVERIEKLPGRKQWTLTLKKMGIVPCNQSKIRAGWWTEVFDAVVVAAVAKSDSPWVPPIPRLKEWAEAFPDRIFHGREYRRPENMRGKNVLVIGGSLSGTGIASDLEPLANVTMSIRTHSPMDIIHEILDRLIPKNAAVVPEIEAFSELSTHDERSVRSASMLLANGSTISKFDYIILATGYRLSLPFLAGFHNSSITGFEEPETRVAPIITDGTHLRSLHWTGHYIDDPTLAFATEDWERSPLQSLAFAKVWSGKARLPSIEKMWKEYPGAGNGFLASPNQFLERLYVTWLNNENLEFGGRLVRPLTIKDRQALEYWAWSAYGTDLYTAEAAAAQEKLPRDQWPAHNGVGDIQGFVRAPKGKGDHPDEQWAELNVRW